MIKRGLGEPIITKYQRLVESMPMVVNLGELDFALLRPHGRSAASVYRRSSNYDGRFSYWIGLGSVRYNTRAQAAQEAYADDDLSKLTTQQKPTEEAMERA